MRGIEALVVGLLTCILGPAHADDLHYPNKAVHLIVGVPPGGGADTVARLLAQKLSAIWDQPVLVDNKPGGDGVIAEETAAHARPDGYTIILVINNHTIAPSQGPLHFDPVKAFAPVSLVASSPQVLVVKPSLGVNSFKEFIELAKAKPNVLNFASSGTGTQLDMRLLISLTGTQLVSINYKGGTDAQVALLSGEVDTLFGSITNYVELAKSGKVKILAVSSRDRATIDPTIPTIAEAGGVDYDITGWYGMLAPAGTPKEIVDKLHDDIVKVSQSPEFKKGLTDQGFTVVASSPAEFDSLIQREIAMWTALMKKIN